jgi:hypothetical protein
VSCTIYLFISKLVSNIIIFLREYLVSRGHKIDQEQQDHDDDSFSSQSDDYNNSTDYQKLEDSENTLTQEINIEDVINQSDLSKSLLHCLDGNELPVQDSPSIEKSRKRQLDNSLKDESSNESLKKPLIEDDSTDF